MKDYQTTKFFEKYFFTLIVFLNTLCMEKKKILSITIATALLGVLAAFLLPQNYLSTVEVKLDYYLELAQEEGVTVATTKTFVADMNIIIAALNVQFVGAPVTANKAKVLPTTVVSARNAIFKISVISNTNEHAISKIQEVLDSSALRVSTESLEDYQHELDILKNNSIPSLKEELVKYESWNMSLEAAEKRMRGMKPSNLLSFYDVQQQTIGQLDDLNERIQSIRGVIFKTEQSQIPFLERQIQLIQSKTWVLSSSRDKVIEKVVTSETPYKSKRVLIIVVAFILGLLGSIFLAVLIDIYQESQRKQSSTRTE